MCGATNPAPGIGHGTSRWVVGLALLLGLVVFLGAGLALADQFEQPTSGLRWTVITGLLACATASVAVLMRQVFQWRVPGEPAPERRGRLPGVLGWQTANPRDRPTPRAGVDDLLSEAVLAYIGPVPRSREQGHAALEARFGPNRTPKLAARVEALMTEMLGIQVDWSRHDLVSGADEARRRMGERHPELGDEALDALTNDFTYSWK